MQAIGKWHLGKCDDRYMATYRGFDSYMGYLDGTNVSNIGCVSSTCCVSNCYSRVTGATPATTATPRACAARRVRPPPARPRRRWTGATRAICFIL
jgi:hypothetical protein|eukprot:COSAG01_NODE_1863_length_9037_cov_37.811591_4_plen_96_part_00